MLHDFLANMVPDQVHRESNTLLALSTVALADVEPRTIGLTERGTDGTYLQDLTGAFGADGGFLYSRTPCEKVDVAAQLAVDHINRDPSAHQDMVIQIDSIFSLEPARKRFLSELRKSFVFTFDLEGEIRSL